MTRYTVYSVGRDGGMATLAETASFAAAVSCRNLMRQVYEDDGRRRHVWISDDNDPERGDVSEEIEGEVSE